MPIVFTVFLRFLAVLMVSEFTNAGPCAALVECFTFIVTALRGMSFFPLVEGPVTNDTQL